MSFRIYFSCSPTGVQQKTDMNLELLAHLKSFGRILTDYLGSRYHGEEGFLRNLAVDYGEFEYAKYDSGINRSKLLVAKIATPSQDMDHKIIRAEAMNKPILGLCHLGECKEVPVTIESDNLTLVEYDSLKEAKSRINKYMKEKFDINYARQETLESYI